MKIPVLAFHDISNRKSNLSISKKSFENIIRFMQKNRKSIFISELNQAIKEKNWDFLKDKYVITFDDAFESVHTNVLKIHKKYFLKCNLFITTNFIGKETSLYSTNKNYPSFKLLNMTQILNLQRTGFELHAHSHKHNFWKLSQSEAEKDIVKSKKILSKIINYNPKLMSFCFPKNLCHEQELINKYFITNFRSTNEFAQIPNKKNEILRFEPRESKLWKLRFYIKLQFF